MAAQSVTVVDVDANVDNEFAREYTLVYQVVTALGDGPIVARDAPGVPKPRAPFSYAGDVDPRAYLINKRARLREADKTARIWRVTCNYSSQPQSSCADQIQNPLTKPTEWSGSFFQSQAIAVKDKDGEAILNAAGQVYDPPPMGDDSRPTIRAVKNFPYLDITLWKSYKDAVNDDLWLGVIPAREAKIQSIVWGQSYSANCTPFYPVTFDFSLDDETYDLSLLERGFYEKVDDKLLVIRDKNHEIKQESSLLTSTGGLLPSTGAPVFTGHRHYKEKDFDKLLLGKPKGTK